MIVKIELFLFLLLYLLNAFVQLFFIFSKTMWQVIFDYEVHCDINNVLYILTCMWCHVNWCQWNIRLIWDN